MGRHNPGPFGRPGRSAWPATESQLSFLAKLTRTEIEFRAATADDTVDLADLRAKWLKAPETVQKAKWSKDGATQEIQRLLTVSDAFKAHKKGTKV